jgi:hypothetical protein
MVKNMKETGRMTKFVRAEEFIHGLILKLISTKDSGLVIVEKARAANTD